MSPERNGEGLGAAYDCGSYLAGHTPHWIQVFRSAATSEAVERGEIESIDGYVITVAIGGQLRRYLNHDPARLARGIELHGPKVRVQEPWSILRVPTPNGSYCFSIAAPKDDSPFACPSGSELLRDGAGGFTFFVPTVGRSGPSVG